MNAKGCSKHTNQKLDTFDWLCDIPESASATDLVEVTFKNTRKGYYRNTNDLTLVKGDVVAVEASPGHDIGTVSMTGQLVIAQMKKYHVDQTRTEIKRIYRLARPNDLERYEESKAKEHDTMLRAREIAKNLNLNMKIGDVEYQGDGNKAIFYYIADERVDFRELIKVLADAFHVRIEMKQIGARQEAGRIGGIGPCGRPLCCSSWMTKFSSVATSSARYQEISLNPQKLAGQCAKLKCCLNFEIDAYVEAQKNIPPRNIPLETKDGTYHHFKTDVFSGIMQYSSAPNMASNLVSIPVERVKEIIALNKQGIKVDTLTESSETERSIDYENVVGQDSLTRFDRKRRRNGGNGKPQRKDRTADNADANNAPKDSAAPQTNDDQSNADAPKDAQRRDNNNRRDRRQRPNAPRNPEEGGENRENRDGNNRQGRPRNENRREGRQRPDRRQQDDRRQQTANGQADNSQPSNPQQEGRSEGNPQNRENRGNRQGNRNGQPRRDNRQRPNRDRRDNRNGDAPAPQSDPQNRQRQQPKDNQPKSDEQ